MTGAPDAGVSRRRSGLAFARRWLFLVLGLGLLGWVLHARGGFTILAAIVEELGARWPLLLVPMAVNGLLFVLAYRSALPDGGRAVPFWVFVRIERSSSVLNSLLPFAGSGGAVMKVALLRHWYRSDEIVAASAWGSLATGLGGVFAALAPLAALALGMEQVGMLFALALVNVLAALPALGVMVFLRHGLVARVARLLRLLPAAWFPWLRTRSLSWAARLDVGLEAAVGSRRADFAKQLAYKLATHVVRVGEIWMVLALLGIPGGLPLALVYHALTRATDTFFSFVPGQLGVTELAATAGFAALGLDAEHGLALALALRFRYFATMILSASAVATSDSVLRRFPPRDHDAAGADVFVPERLEAPPGGRASRSGAA